jgi:hypothetical protein
MHTISMPKPNSMPKPKFGDEHPVRFAGGEGIVRSANWESGCWTYVIEMALGEEPEFGRIGPETTVLLEEADLHGT